MQDILNIFLREYWPEIRKWNNFPKQLVLDVDELDTEMSSFNVSQELVHVALVGAFSSGKSSFLNALLGKKIAKEGVNPTTKCRADFKYGESLKVIDTVSQKVINLSDYEDLSSYTNGDTSSGFLRSQFEIEIPDMRLQGLLLSDTPGFTSLQVKDGNGYSDYDISMECCKKADYIFFVVSAMDGGLKDDQAEFLSNCRHKKIVLIVSWVDKRWSGHRDICKKLKEKCQEKEIELKAIVPFAAKCQSVQEDKKKFVETCKDQVWDLLKDISEDANERKRQKFIYLKEKANEIYLRLEKFVRSEYEALKQEKKEFEDRKKSVLLNDILVIGCMIENLDKNFNWRRFSGWTGGAYLSCYTVFVQKDRYRNWVLPEDEKIEKVKKSLLETLKSYNIPLPEKCAQKIYNTFCERIRRIQFSPTEAKCFWQHNAYKLSVQWDNKFREMATQEIRQCNGALKGILADAYDEKFGEDIKALDNKIKFLTNIINGIFDTNNLP